MIKETKLDAKGYRKYSSGGAKKPFAPHFWARWVTDAVGVRLYAIEFYRWDYLASGRESHPWSAEASLYGADGKPFRVVLDPMQGDETVDTVEAFYAETYAKLGCVPDPYNG